MIAPSARLLKVPVIGVAAMLLMTVNVVPGGQESCANVLEQNRCTTNYDPFGCYLIRGRRIAVNKDVVAGIAVED